MTFNKKIPWKKVNFLIIFSIFIHPFFFKAAIKCRLSLLDAKKIMLQYKNNNKKNLK